MYKSSLCPKARDRFSGKRHAGKLARVVWEGGDGKGVICTTSPAPYFIPRGEENRKAILLPYSHARDLLSQGNVGMIPTLSQGILYVYPDFDWQ